MVHLSPQISETEVRVLIDFPDKIPSTAAGSAAVHVHVLNVISRVNTTHVSACTCGCVGELDSVLREKVCPQLPASMRPAFLEAVSAGRLKSMPNCIMPARPYLVG